MIWMPNFLSKQMGFSLTKSSLWTAVTIVGMSLGIWVFGQLADRIGRKPTFLIFQVGSVISVLTLFAAERRHGHAVGGRHHGLVRQRHDGRLRCCHQRGLSHRRPRRRVLFNIGRAVALARW